MIPTKVAPRMPSLPPLPDIEAEALKDKTPAQSLDYLRLHLRDDTRAGAKRLLSKFEKAVQREGKEKAKGWQREGKGKAKGNAKGRLPFLIDF